MDSFALLETLSNAFGVSGFEDEVRQTIQTLVAPYADDVRTDALGNLIVTRKGSSGGTLMLDAHMDEVGLMISHIEDDGFLRFVTIGGWDPRVLPAHAVTVRTRSGTKIRGVIGSLPPHVSKPEERDKPVPLDQMFIDVGARSAAEARRWGLGIGDPAVPSYPCERLRETWVLGKALDDRAGCAALVRVLEGLAAEKPGVTLVCNFAVGEETGLRGARTAAFQIAPDLALAVEGTVAADVPGVPPARQPSRVGAGPALTLADSTIIVSPRVVRALERVADEHGIPYQHKRPLSGGTDAGAIHLTRGGVPTGAVSVPCRYIHAPLSLLDLGDFEGLVRLVRAFALEAHRILE
jgi:tetrahedral aminopeptidase